MKSAAFEELLTSVGQAGRIRRGTLKPARVTAFRPAQVKAIRGKLRASQPEFAMMIGEGAGPQRSAFLSSFFTLVGCHGAHVTAGLLWIGTMMAQIWAKGFKDHILRRLLCLSVFWHALDIIWVAIFTIVYLIGTLP